MALPRTSALISGDKYGDSVAHGSVSGNGSSEDGDLEFAIRLSVAKEAWRRRRVGGWRVGK